MQILKGTPATMELKVYSSGDLTNLDASPTLAITDANGDAVSSGAVSTPETGIYRSVLDGQSELKALKAVWSGTLGGDAVSFTQHYEIVGNLLFTEAEARGARFTGQQAPLSDESAYPDSVIARKRAEITNQFEDKTSHSWIRRYGRVEVTGTGSKTLSLFRGFHRDVDGNDVGGKGRIYNIARIISAEIDGTAVDLANVKLHDRRLILTDGVWTWSSDPFNIVIEYEYGDDPVDLEARENGLRTIVANLIPSDVPDYSQTISQTNQSVSYIQDQGIRVWPAKTKEWLDRNPAKRIPTAI